MNDKFKFEDFEIDYITPLGKVGFGDIYKVTKKILLKFMQLKGFQLMISE